MVRKQNADLFVTRFLLLISLVCYDNEKFGWDMILGLLYMKNVPLSTLPSLVFCCVSQIAGRRVVDLVDVFYLLFLTDILCNQEWHDYVYRLPGTCHRDRAHAYKREGCCSNQPWSNSSK